MIFKIYLECLGNVEKPSNLSKNYAISNKFIRIWRPTTTSCPNDSIVDLNCTTFMWFCFCHFIVDRCQLEAGQIHHGNVHAIMMRFNS